VCKCLFYNVFPIAVGLTPLFGSVPELQQSRVFTGPRFLSDFVQVLSSFVFSPLKPVLAFCNTLVPASFSPSLCLSPTTLAVSACPSFSTLPCTYLSGPHPFPMIETAIPRGGKTPPPTACPQWLSLSLIVCSFLGGVGRTFLPVHADTLLPQCFLTCAPWLKGVLPAWFLSEPCLFPSGPMCRRVPPVRYPVDRPCVRVFPLFCWPTSFSDVRVFTTEGAPPPLVSFRDFPPRRQKDFFLIGPQLQLTTRGEGFGVAFSVGVDPPPRALCGLPGNSFFLHQLFVFHVSLLVYARLIQLFNLVVFEGQIYFETPPSGSAPSVFNFFFFNFYPRWFHFFKHCP